MEKTGIIEEIIYRNEDNGYSVLTVLSEGETETFVGYFRKIAVGEEIHAVGEYKEHSVYGKQFAVSDSQTAIPKDGKAMERYLASGAIKGIGAATAKKIITRFGEDTFRIMEEEPERLAEISGISHKKAMAIAEIFFEQKNMRKIFLFLQEYEISMTYAMRIYEKYHEQTFYILREKPYRLASEIAGIGFQTADCIAAKSGIAPDSPERILCGMEYVLQLAELEGHVYLPKPILFEKTCHLLGLSPDYLEPYLIEMQGKQLIMVKKTATEERVYLAALYRMERYVASKLMTLFAFPLPDLQQELWTEELRKENFLDEMQREAIRLSFVHNVLVITGGPGTGKTTIINHIIHAYVKSGRIVELAAPTGRAAKRMSEATGRSSKTIHRLLENYYLKERGQQQFQRDEDYPLECDLLILDEVSMVDLTLMYHLMKAIPQGCRLILVGDRHQLPSIGAGNLLKDILNSEIPKVCLQKIYRQREDSAIVFNAAQIKEGHAISYQGKSDFFFLKRQDSAQILQGLIELITKRLPDFTGLHPVREMQVLTPMKKGMLGAKNLNKELQAVLNPPTSKKKEKLFRETLFREGDKVMQIKNDYQMEWAIYSRLGEVLEEGMGIFNGDIGVVEEINDFEEVIRIRFDEDRVVDYPFHDLEGLDLAYAMTIHKSQGSEYPLVLLPIFDAGERLLTRNLFYTAVTRAAQYVVMIGREEMIAKMIANHREINRYSSLTEVISEMKEVMDGS